jgi:hypothetical protein
MLDKARLGTRYVCYSCGTKFYDLNKPTPSCPECSADQRQAPVRDIKSLLSKGGGRRKSEDVDEIEEEDLDEEVGVDDDADEDDDDLGLLGDDEEDEGGGGEELD